jgi:deoxyribonuclease IV
MRVGAHNSIAGGLHNAVDQALHVGGETMQIFCKNQRQWEAKPLEEEPARLFRDAVTAAAIGPVMVHDSYLINMGAPDPEKRERSRQAFMGELARCEALGIPYLNFHPGSHTHPDKGLRDDPATRRAALDRIAEAMVQCIDETPGGSTRLVIENAAGQGTNVGSTWEEVGYLADQVGHPDRVGVCVDTQHSWASGYDWVDHYDEVWDRFADQVGLGRLVAFHLNDSKQPCGARVDRHDNIPDGHLGEGFWATLMQDARFRDLAGYLETPLVGEDASTWARELAYLKRLRSDGAGG